MSGGVPDESSGARPERIRSLDLLRGIVMVVMALDHCRDFFGGAFVDPTDLDTTTPALFLTRWITHFCAPVFVLLAGTAAFLYGRGRSRAALARFLVTRGLWLIVLELTVVHLGWFLSFGKGFLILQVIAAIGAAMVALAGLVFLPTAVVAGIGLAIVCGHNALDGLAPGDLRPLGEWAPTAWTLAHGAFAPIFLSPSFPLPPLRGQTLLVIYAWLPWSGVMACGYGLGALVARPRAERRRLLARLGLGLVLLFVVLRWTNAYGDPAPWERRESALFTLLSFVRTTKYPPSLLFLAMTLGPALCFLAAADRERGAPQESLLGRLRGALTVFGRVPLFYYVLHLFLAHLLAVATYRLLEGRTIVFGLRPPGAPWLGLGAVYAAWGAVVVLLYPLCRWYAGVKRRGRSALWSYL